LLTFRFDSMKLNEQLVISRQLPSLLWSNSWAAKIVIPKEEKNKVLKKKKLQFNRAYTSTHHKIIN
jgi:hypothetical protein